MYKWALLDKSLVSIIGMYVNNTFKDRRILLPHNLLAFTRTVLLVTIAKETITSFVCLS